MRTIAIANFNKSNNVRELVDALMKSKSYDKLIVFTRFKEDIATVCGDIPLVYWSAKESDDVSTNPKFRNWMLRKIKEKTNITDWLHVIDDSIELLKDPTLFMNDIEHLMTTFDINNYFGTITDTCNRVYDKYNPRLSISLDKEGYTDFGFGKKILFCSHSNIQWITYNLLRADDNELYFDEKFSVDMFFIIEFLARRRNTHPESMYFMNQYLTCESEHGLYDFKSGIVKEQHEDIQKVMQEEDAMFRNMKINYQPDNNIDAVLERTYLKLKSKLQK